MKHQRHHSTMLHCVRQAFFIFIFGMSILITESLQSSDGKFYENNENTRAAIEDLHEVLRYLFPVVPHKSRLVWSGGKHQHGTLIHGPRYRLSLGVSSHRPVSSAQPARPHTTRGSLADERELLEPSSQPVVASKLSPYRTSMATASITTNDDRGQATLNRLPEQNIHRALEHLFHHQQSVSELSGSLDSSSSAQIDSRRNLKSLLEKHRSRESKTQLMPQSQPKSQQKEKYKRGPECMRKCIMQGHLHPVQCHSLC